jgi:hypothetical protein
MVRKKVSVLFAALLATLVIPSVALSAVESGSTYRILSKSSGKFLDIVNNSEGEGARLCQNSFSANENQMWQTEIIRNNNFRIKSLFSEKVVDLEVANQNDEVPVVQKTFYDLPNQIWSFIPVENGYYKIINALTGKCLEVIDASNQDGALIQQRIFANTDNQKWMFDLVTERPSAVYDFESTTEGWTGKNASVALSTTWKYSGARSLSANVNLAYNKSYYMCLTKNLDLTGIGKIKAYVNSSSTVVNGIKAGLYILVGDNWSWYGSSMVSVRNTAQGYELIFDLANVPNVNKVREIGVQFISYQGRGTARLYVDNVKLLSSAPQPGDDVALYIGTTTNDNSGNTFLTKNNYYQNDFSISKIDLLTQQNFWTTVTTAYTTSYLDNSDNLYISVHYDFSKIDKSSGAILWTIVNGGSPKIETASHILLTTDSTFNLVDKSTHVVTWTYRRAGYNQWVSEIENGVIYCAEQPKDGGSTAKYSAINLNTGAVIWSYNTGAQYAATEPFTLDPNAIYIHDDQTCVKVIKSTGVVQWSFTANGSFWVSIENGNTYLYSSNGSGNSLLRLNSTTGSVIWSYHTNLDISSTSFGTYFVVTERDYNLGRITIKRIDALNGNINWSITRNTTSAYLEKIQGYIYLTTDNQIIRINENNGSNVWSIVTTQYPQLINIESAGAVFLNDMNSLRRFNPVNGQIIWTKNVIYPSSNVNVIESGTRLIATYINQNTTAFTIKHFDYNGSELFSFAANEQLRGSEFSGTAYMIYTSNNLRAFQSNGAALWSTNYSSSRIGRALRGSDNGYYYIYDFDYGKIINGHLLAVNKTTGQIRWDKDIAGVYNVSKLSETLVRVDSQVYSSPATIHIMYR